MNSFWNGNFEEEKGDGKGKGLNYVDLFPKIDGGRRETITPPVVFSFFVLDFPKFG